MMNVRNLVLLLFSVTAVLLVVLSAGLVYFYPGSVNSDVPSEISVSPEQVGTKEAAQRSMTASSRTVTITVIPLEPEEESPVVPTLPSAPAVRIDTASMAPGITARIVDAEADASTTMAVAQAHIAPSLQQTAPVKELDVSTVATPEIPLTEKPAERPVATIVAVEPSIPMLAEREQQSPESREPIVIQEPVVKGAGDFAPLSVPEPVIPEPVVVAEVPAPEVEPVVEPTMPPIDKTSVAQEAAPVEPAVTEPEPVVEPAVAGEPAVAAVAEPTPEPIPEPEPVPEPPVIVAEASDREPATPSEPAPAPITEPEPVSEPELEQPISLPDTSPVYWAVVGVYQTLEEAEQSQDQLFRENGVYGMITIQDQGSYHLQIGPYSNALEAGRMGELIASLDGFAESRVKLTIPRF